MTEVGPNRPKPNLPDSERAGTRVLPATFTGGMDYFNEVILPHSEIFAHYEGEHIAVISDSIIDFDDNPHNLAVRVHANFPSLVLYMPHVVRLEETPQEPDRQPPLPEHFATAMRYYQQILRNETEWMKEHNGRSVAIIGRQVVDEEARGEGFSAFYFRVADIYGFGDLFMPIVDLSSVRRVEKIGMAGAKNIPSKNSPKS